MNETKEGNNQMLEIKGKVNTAICYAKVIEDEAIDQIRRMCDYDMTAGSRIRIMPEEGCTMKIAPLLISHVGINGTKRRQNQFCGLSTTRSSVTFTTPCTVLQNNMVLRKKEMLKRIWKWPTVPP